MSFSTKFRSIVLMLAVIIIFGSSTEKAKGSFVAVSSRTDLAGTDSLDWNSFANSISTPLPNPSVVTSTNGVSATVSADSILTSYTNNIGAGWAFPIGTRVLDTFFGSTITVTFGTNVIAAGAEMATEDSSFSINNSGFNGKVEALDEQGSVLFTYALNNPALNPGFAFLGIKASAGNSFRALRFKDESVNNPWLAINKLDFTVAPTSVIPEPGSAVIFGLGLACFGAIRRRRLG